MLSIPEIIDIFDDLCRATDDTTVNLLAAAERCPEILPQAEEHATITQYLFDLRDEATRTLTPETAPMLIARLRAVTEHAARVARAALAYYEARHKLSMALPSGDVTSRD